MKNLIEIGDCTEAEIQEIWSIAELEESGRFEGLAGWSFEGNGIRTRTTFLRAFSSLGLGYIELPNLLKSSERTADLASYLDPHYALYVIRESNHARLRSFSMETRHPVINAMSSQEHPCEVLTDAYYVDREMGPLHEVTILIWGPTTNVFRSWFSLAAVMGFEIFHFSPKEYAEERPFVTRLDSPEIRPDIVITDGWPQGFDDANYTLTEASWKRMGRPPILPTPPFTIGQELGFDITKNGAFVGYKQKELLLDVQKAIIRFVMPPDQGCPIDIGE